MLDLILDPILEAMLDPMLDPIFDPILDPMLNPMLILDPMLLFFREGRGNASQPSEHQRIGDVVLRNFDAVTTDYYLKYVDAHSLILDKLEDALAKDTRFAQIYREFEEQKVCYLPITTLLLKPMHRILHYELLLDSE